MSNSVCIENNWSREIKVRITKTETVFFDLCRFLKSKVFSKKKKKTKPDYILIMMINIIIIYIMYGGQLYVN